jgi:hypothetical protein
MYPPPVAPQQRRWIVRAAFLLVPLCALALVVVAVTGFIRLGGDARCLRNSLTQSTDSGVVSWQKKLEVSVGPISCQLLRAGLSFAPLPSDARTALRAVRGAEVGIYKLGAGSNWTQSDPLLGAADKAMASRGWDRVVGVAKEHGLVAIYAPRKVAGGTKIQVCVAVLNQDQLVVASGRSDLAPLVELAMSQAEWKNPHKWVAARL